MKRDWLALLLPLVLAGCVVKVGPSSTTSSSVQPVSSASTTQANGPIIDTMSVSSATTSASGAPIALAIAASNPTTGEPLTYQWSSTAGALSATRGSGVQWFPPSSPGIYQVGILVATPEGQATVGTFNLQVVATASAIATPAPSPTPSASPSVS